MPNPYSILGIPNDSDEAIVKAAYKELAVKYAPDNYAGNPLADLAASKMKSIDQAYDEIIAQKRLGIDASKAKDASNFASGSDDGSTSTASSSTSNAFDANYIRSLISQNRIPVAEDLLLKVERSNRNAEWSFLMGKTMYAKGWIDEAKKHYTNAVSSDPYNSEYKQALESINTMRNQGPEGSPYGNPYGTGGGYNNGPQMMACSGCDLCTSMLCANCLCNCLGGGC